MVNANGRDSLLRQHQARRDSKCIAYARMIYDGRTLHRVDLPRGGRADHTFNGYVGFVAKVTLGLRPPPAVRIIDGPLRPAGALTAGSYASGPTVGVPAHTVSFSEVEGWVTPDAIAVTVRD